MIFLAEKFVLSMIIRIFALSVLVRPLNNAQIVRGVFVYIRFIFKYGNGRITTLYETLDEGAFLRNWQTRITPSANTSLSTSHLHTRQGYLWGDKRVDLCNRFREYLLTAPQRQH